MSKVPEALPVARENLLGTLVVVVLKAQHLIDNHKFYKQDPYVRISLSGATKRTPVDPKGGQHPVWDAELRLPVSKDVSKKNRTMEISCWSEERKEDQLLGEAELDITETLKTGEFDDWVPLKLNSTQRGDVYLEMTFFAAGPAPLQRRASKLSPAQRLSRPADTHGNYTFKPQSPEVNNTALPSDHHNQANVGRPGHARIPSHSPLGRQTALPPLPEEAAASGPPPPASLPSILRAGPNGPVQRPVSEVRPVPAGAPVHARYPSSSPPRTSAERPYGGEETLPYPSHITPAPAASNQNQPGSAYHSRTTCSSYVPPSLQPQATPRPSHQHSQSVGSTPRAPQSEYVSAYPSSYQAVQPSSYQAAQPAGYRQSTTPEYQTPGTSSYQPAPASSYQPPANAGYQPPSQPRYEPPNVNYQPPSPSQVPANAGYQPLPQPRHDQPPNPSYEHRPTSSYSQSSSPNYNQSSFNYGAAPPAVSSHPPSPTPVPSTHHQPSRYSPPYPLYPHSSHPHHPTTLRHPNRATPAASSSPSPSRPSRIPHTLTAPRPRRATPSAANHPASLATMTSRPIPPKAVPDASAAAALAAARAARPPRWTLHSRADAHTRTECARRWFAPSIPEPTHTPAPAPRPDAGEAAARRAQEYEEEQARRRREQEEKDAELAKSWIWSSI